MAFSSWFRSSQRSPGRTRRGLVRAGWAVAGEEAWFTTQDGARLELPAKPFQDFAGGSDGAIVLAYGKSVAWLPRAASRMHQGIRAVGRDGGRNVGVRKRRC